MSDSPQHEAEQIAQRCANKWVLDKEGCQCGVCTALKHHILQETGLVELVEIKHEVAAILDRTPKAVRVREGNGPENLAASLAVLIANFNHERDQLREQNNRVLEQMSGKSEYIDQLRADLHQARLDIIEIKRQHEQEHSGDEQLRAELAEARSQINVWEQRYNIAISKDAETEDKLRSELATTKSALEEIRKYCESDLCYNSQDIHQIHKLAMQKDKQ